MGGGGIPCEGEKYILEKGEKKQHKKSTVKGGEPRGKSREYSFGNSMLALLCEESPRTLKGGGSPARIQGIKSVNPGGRKV